MSVRVGAPDLVGGNAHPSRRRVRIATHDSLVRMRQSVRVGPVDLPPVADLRAAFVQLASLGSATRLGLVLGPDGHWVYLGAGIADRVDDLIRVIPESTDDLRAWIEANWIPDLPIQFAVAGQHIALVADHRLMDAALGLKVHSLLINVARGVPAATAFAEFTKHPLADALWNTLGPRPAAWKALIQNLRGRRAEAQAEMEVALAEDPEPATDGPGIVGDRAGTAAVHLQVTMPRGALAGIRRWRRGKLSLSASLLFVAAAALREVGVNVAPRGLLIVDLRRYLPEGRTTLGNFITGVRIPLSGPASEPRVLNSWLEDALEVGRPLAALALNVAKAASRSLRPENEASVPASFGDPVTVSMSSIGLARDIDALPWLAPPADRRVEISADAIDPDSVGFIAFTARGMLHLSVSFQPGRIPPETMQRALELMVADPESLLPT